MRVEMGKYNGEYIEVIGRLKKITYQNDYCNLLFTDIVYEGKEITDHVWVWMGNIRNRSTFSKCMEIDTIYKMRGKVYVYKKRSKIDGTKNVEDFGFKSVRIEMGE